MVSTGASQHTPAARTMMPAHRQRSPPPARLALLVPSVQEVVCAVNGGDDVDEDELHGEQQQATNVIQHSLAHLWTDLPVAGSGVQRQQQATGTKGSGGCASSSTPALAAGTSGAAASMSSPLSGSSIPSTSTLAFLRRSDTLSEEIGSTSRSPSSCSNISNAASNGENRFSLASTAATSEGCHNMTSLSSLAGAGAVPVASSIGLTQLDIDNQDEATTSTRDRREVQDTFSSNTEEILATGSVSIAPTLSQIEPSMEDPTPPYARESSIAERPSSSSGSSRPSTCISITSTCAGPWPSSASSTGPAHKRSFLSAVLSRSTSLSGNIRNEALHRSRTISSQGSSRGLSNVSAGQTSGSHARHASNPPTPTSSLPQATITPASPLPHTSLSSSARLPSAATSSPSLDEVRRSSCSSQRPVVPPPLDSVFSTASRPFVHEDETPTAALRAVSPSSVSAAATSSSRAARYLSRHFAGPSTASGGLATGQNRFDEQQAESMRRSPTPTRFFGGSSSNAPRTASTSMPMLSGSSNNSSSSLATGKEKEKELSKTPLYVPLSTFNLALNPLTPQMSLGRAGQPLCGAVLDGKYLLIGTSLGLDFLPLHREGNRPLKGRLFGSVSTSFSERFGSSPGEASSSQSPSGSSSATSGISSNNGIQGVDENLNRKVRKPIPLVKKTRFKQLVILGQRSNVLLAVAGRNDHVRVYSLDSLRKLIEKKMKDVDANMPSSPGPSSALSNKGLGLSLPKKGQPPVPPMPNDYKGKRRAVPSSPSPEQTARSVQSHHQGIVGQYSPPPAYEQHRGSSKRGGVEEEPPLSARTSASFQSNSSNSVRGSHSPRERVASSSARARRAKSRETLRRASAGSSHSSVHNHHFASASSRRGSAATITPATVTQDIAAASGFSSASHAGRRRPSVATIVPTSPTSGNFTAGIHSTITRRGSSAQLADMGQVTSEQHSPRLLTSTNAITGVEDDNESYEWVDAPEDDDDLWTSSSSGYSFPPHPVAPRREINSVPAVPPLPAQYASMSTSAFTRTRAASGTSSMTNRIRMTPRSARARAEVDTEDEEEDTASIYTTPHLGESNLLEELSHSESLPAATSSSHPLLPKATVQSEDDARRKQIKEKRRVSLAEILNEIRDDPFRANDLPPLPTRGAHSDPLPSGSGFSSVSQNLPGPPITPKSASRFVARSAVSGSTHGALSDLADFLNEGPIPASSSVNSVDVPSSSSMRPSNFLRRTMTSASVPEMQQRPRLESPVTSSLMNVRSPSSSTFSTSGRKSRFVPRDAQVTQRSPEELEGRESLLDLLRDGPPETPNPGAPARTSSQAKKLQKAQHKSSISLQSVVSSRSSPATSGWRSASAQQSQSSRQRAPSSESQGGVFTPRHRTRSDGATLHRGGNFILPADEIVPVPVSVTTPAPTDSFTGTSKARKESAMQPRSPTSRQFIAVHDPSDGELSGTQSMARGFSLQEMLASGRFDRESDQINSPVLGSDDDGARLSDRPSTTPTNDTNGSNANDGQSERRNRRNRWSLLAGRRGLPDGADPTAPNAQIARRIEGSIAGEPSIGPGASALAQEAVAVPQRREEFPTTAATAPAPPPILKPSAPGQLMDDESPPFGNLTPDMQQQIQDVATDPDGTTIMFTQQRTRSSGEVTSVASALNGASVSANGSTSTKGNAGLQKDSISGNLEYVKLARTKGSRFIRASETGKRTYLAVLCGEQGERIELFTGARNVSLSLNRTFVLPETPRTIEFQLQGEDLLDLYLIYDSAIFALEPSTVRVREVGIQRNERRQARRERERIQRQADTLEGVDTSTIPPPSPTSPASRAARDRQVSASSEIEELPSENVVPSLSAAENVPSQPATRTPSRASSLRVAPRPPEEPQPAANATEPATTGMVTSTVTTERNSTAAPTADDAIPQPATPTLPYTTFQQLEYLPQIPPSVLASSYIIPPTYEAVLSASPNPALNTSMFISNQLSFGARTSSNASSATLSSYASSPEVSRSATPLGPGSRIASPSSALLTPDWRSPSRQQQQEMSPPLLSPVSLLANPSAKNIGPPGLFFVTKGRKSTGIVDGDGRSVIRQPISWLNANEESLDLPEQPMGLDHLSRLEVILTSDDMTRVCIVAFGPTSVRAIELGHSTQSHSLEVIPYEALKRQTKSRAMVNTLKMQGKEVFDEMVFVRDVTYLAKAGQCTFFAERVGSNVAIYSVGATGYAFQ